MDAKGKGDISCSTVLNPSKCDRKNTTTGKEKENKGTKTHIKSVLQLPVNVTE